MINLGLFGKPFGLKGEIYFYPVNVDSHSLKLNQQVVISKSDQSTITSIITQLRWQNDSVVMKLQGIDSKEAAGLITHSHLLIERDQLPELSESEYYLHDVVGFEVYSEDGKFQGIVDHFSFNHANQSIMHVKSQGKILDLLVKPFVKDVDLQQRRCYIIIPDYEE